ncbi:hypothetical protein EYR40_006115 [Pleurotus pulmonarius]|nr:hypothetical protein EYR36_010737 [Pleurotus pulmonarius]KAF4599027.1 hypothetical protein EYR40_006115 [Pleurotus pulmonarius]
MYAPVPPPLLDVHGILASSIGALLIGGFFSICLFGANSLQTWYYYQHYPTDAALMKVTVGAHLPISFDGDITVPHQVAFVWILEAVHAVFLCHAIYSYVVLGFGNVLMLDVPVWSIASTILVALFFLISNAAVTWTSYGIALGIHSYLAAPRSWEIIASVSLGLGGAIDLMIACCLGYYLHHGRSGITKTDKIVNKLIFWAVNVGILTSVADFAVMSLTIPQHAKNLNFVAVYQIISNLYAASMMATYGLNIRPYSQQHVLDERSAAVDLKHLPSSHINKFVTVVSDADQSSRREAQDKTGDNIHLPTLPRNMWDMNI